ncbi:MAG UNVERIFIED_CONTAM: hypothetical protein LVR18_36685 [Planctomycetaceae bacterium]
MLRPALELLAGAGVLEVNRQPAELERLQPELWVEAEEGGLRLISSLGRYLVGSGWSAGSGGLGVIGSTTWTVG